MDANQAGFTPLHQALKSGNPDNMRAYFDEVRHAVGQKIIRANDYGHLLTGANDAGFTPLHEALFSGNPENMRAYLTEIRRARDQGVIRDDDYRELLIKPNRAGFTPLHQAANSGNLEITQVFFEELVRVHSKETVYRCLTTPVKGHQPSCQRSANKPQADNINAYLDQKREEFSQYRDSRQQRFKGKRANMDGHASKTRAGGSRSTFFGASEYHHDLGHLREKQSYHPSNSTARVG